MSRIVWSVCFAVLLLRASNAQAETKLNANAQGNSPLRTSPAADPLDRPLQLAPTDAGKNEGPALPRSPNLGLAMSTIVGGLAICLGIFLLIVVLTRKNSANKFGPLPSEVIESLGRMMLNHRQQLQLIRLGRKLVLLNVTAQGTTAICEIDDPDEVTRIAGICQQGQPNSVTATFRDVLGQFGQGSADEGYDDEPRSTERPRATLVHPRRPTRDGFHG